MPDRKRFGWVAQHVPTVTAAVVALLYLLGILSTVARSRATGLDVGHVLRLIPLEEHLLNGVGTVLSPSVVLLGACLTTGYVWMGKLPPDQAARVIAAFDSPFVRRRYIVGAGIGGLLAALVTQWYIVVLVALTVSTWFGMSKVLRSRRIGAARVPKLFFVANVGVLLVLTAAETFLRSTAFPTVEVSTEARQFTGPLIAVTDGLIYVGAHEARKLYLAVPIGQVVELSAEPPKERRPEPSLLNLLGVDWPRGTD